MRCALRLGSRVSVASAAAVIPATAAACLKRHQSLNELDVQDDDVALADASEQVPANDPAENAVAVAVN